MSRMIKRKKGLQSTTKTSHHSRMLLNRLIEIKKEEKKEETKKEATGGLISSQTISQSQLNNATITDTRVFDINRKKKVPVESQMPQYHLLHQAKVKKERRKWKRKS